MVLNEMQEEGVVYNLSTNHLVLNACLRAIGEIKTNLVDKAKASPRIGDIFSA